MTASAKTDGRPAIFITGAASGIGLATARRFAAGGWFVGLADIDARGLAAALEAIGPANGMVCGLDVRHRSAWKRELAAFAKATAGRLEVLMNNAGVARGGYLEAQSAEDVDLQLDVNLKGVLNGCQAAFDLLAATPGAIVVNVASVAGVVAPPRMAVYAATEFAVRGLSEALEAESRGSAWASAASCPGSPTRRCSTRPGSPATRTCACHCARRRCPSIRWRTSPRPSGRPCMARRCITWSAARRGRSAS